MPAPGQPDGQAVAVVVFELPPFKQTSAIRRMEPPPRTGDRPKALAT